MTDTRINSQNSNNKDNSPRLTKPA